MAEHEQQEGETVRIGKRCYVGNLAWKTSWQDLKDKFRECGSVVYANVMRDDDGEWARCSRVQQPEAAYTYTHAKKGKGKIGWVSRHQQHAC